MPSLTLKRGGGAPKNRCAPPFAGPWLRKHDDVPERLTKRQKKRRRDERRRKGKEAEAAAAADVGGDDDDEQQRVVHREVEHESLLDRLLNEDVELEELDEEEAEPAAGASDFVEEQENVE